MLATSCVDPFQGDIRSEELNILVVDGFMNTASSEVNVRLSRTMPLEADSTVSTPELNSTVSIEDNTGKITLLNDHGSGDYNLSNYPFDYSKLYRLNVTRTDGSSYQSDFVPPVKTPPIDSVTWRAEGDNVMLYVNTHDFEAKEPQYYLWDWVETWEHWTYYHSEFYVQDGRAVQRSPSDYVDVCWTSVSSPAILAFTTRNLSKNVVRDFKINEINGDSRRLYWQYSVNVRQRSITREAFDYWQQMKTANESTGGLFAPMPPEVRGNFKSIDSDKIVLGYFSAGTTSEQRIFIKHNDLPGHIRALKLPDNDCRNFDDSLPIISMLEIFYAANGTPLIDSAATGYYIKARECLDCRVRGGVNKKPSFWP